MTDNGNITTSTAKRLMVPSDAHIHTTLCDGKNTVEEMVCAAIEKGFETIGISGHSFTAFDTSYCIQSYHDYFVEIDRVKALYGDKIDILSGTEFDYHSVADAAAFDYTIGSLHCFRDTADRYYPLDMRRANFSHTIPILFGGDRTAAVKYYYKKEVDMVKKLRPTIIGHFDLITKFDGENSTCRIDTEVYETIVRDAIDKIMNGIEGYIPVFEVNTGAMFKTLKTEQYPSDLILNILKEYDANLILSSDSHTVDAIGFKFNEMYEKLRLMGHKNLKMMTGRGLVDIGLY